MQTFMATEMFLVTTQDHDGPYRSPSLGSIPSLRKFYLPFSPSRTKVLFQSQVTIHLTEATRPGEHSVVGFHYTKRSDVCTPKNWVLHPEDD